MILAIMWFVVEGCFHSVTYEMLEEIPIGLVEILSVLFVIALLDKIGRKYTTLV